jgi:hypothetical protein
MILLVFWRKKINAISLCLSLFYGDVIFLVKKVFSCYLLELVRNFLHIVLVLLVSSLIWYKYLEAKSLDTMIQDTEDTEIRVSDT